MDVVQALELVAVAAIAGTLGPFVTTRLQSRTEREAREEHDLRSLFDEGAGLLVAGSNALAHAHEECRERGFTDTDETRKALRELRRSYEAIRLFASRVGIRLKPTSALREPLLESVGALADGEAILRTADAAADGRAIRTELTTIDTRLVQAGESYIDAARELIGTQELTPERRTRRQWPFRGT